MSYKQRLGPLLICLLAAVAAHAQLPSAPEPAIQPATPPQSTQPALPTEQAIQPGSLNGTVTDTNQDPVPHTSVTLDGPVTHRTIPADANGFFQFSDLPFGTYHLSIAAQGFTDYRSADIALKPGQALDLPVITMQITGTASSVTVTYTQQEIATQQVHVEEQQRLIGAIPNFYVVYTQNAVPLGVRQKFSLAWRSLFDPSAFIITAGVAGLQQGTDEFKYWGQDWAGYGQRYGAAFADGSTSLILTGFAFPVLFHQDPRYFYKGTGTTRSRILYAITTSTVVCKGDNGKWEPNYSNVLGNLAAAGMSNIYYPASNATQLTFINWAVTTGADAVAGLMEEFLLKHFTTHSGGTP